MKINEDVTMRDKQTNKKTREDKATQLMDTRRLTFATFSVIIFRQPR